ALEPAWPVRVLGTDINRAALDEARAGRYGAWSLRGPSEMTSGWVEPRPDGGANVTPRLRERVRFEYLNLCDACYPSLVTGTQGVDVVFCRNVLIYLSPEAAAAVLERLRLCLVEGGHLVVSALDVGGAVPGMEPVS